MATATMDHSGVVQHPFWLPWNAELRRAHFCQSATSRREPPNTTSIFPCDKGYLLREMRSYVLKITLANHHHVLIGECLSRVMEVNDEDATTPLVTEVVRDVRIKSIL